jgi:hypothetical protein
MVAMTSMVSDFIQPHSKFFVLLRQLLTVELQRGQSMLKDAKLTIMVSLTKSMSLVLSEIRNLK